MAGNTRSPHPLNHSGEIPHHTIALLACAIDVMAWSFAMSHETKTSSKRTIIPLSLLTNDHGMHRTP
jgi:hypothetical protein